MHTDNKQSGDSKYRIQTFHKRLSPMPSSKSNNKLQVASISLYSQMSKNENKKHMYYRNKANIK